MTTNAWFHLVGLISAGLLGLGFITGLVSVGLSWKVNAELQTELRKMSGANLELEKDLTEEKKKLAALEQTASDSKAAQQRVETELAKAKEAQAKAEESLQKFKFRALLPRSITDESLEILRNSPKGSVDLLYQDNNPEAYSLARELQVSLGWAGWTASEPKPTTVDRIPHTGVKLEVGIALYGEQPTSGMPLVLKEPAQTLWKFFDANLQSAGTGGFSVNKDLPPDAMVIVIGPKQ
jgi:hypothetical protein